MNGQSGKGDRDRTTNHQRMRDNYDLIDWKESTMTDSTSCYKPIANVNRIAERNHQQWLDQDDRSYSPHNMAWILLTDEARTQISRNVRTTLDYLIENGMLQRDDIIDPYEESA